MQAINIKYNYLIYLIIVIISLPLTNCYKSVTQTDSEAITLGTFNLSWLGDGIGDNNPRTESDYQRIADIISQLKPDIMALEEVENDAAMLRLTKYLNGYSFIVAKTGYEQNVAVLYNNELNIKNLGDFNDIKIESGNRGGMILQLKKGNFDFVMLVVHLKSTSRYDSTDELKAHSRKIRLQQAQIITHWADSMLTYGKEKDIIIAGDFNDSPKKTSQPTLTSLANDANLKFLTEDLKSCKFTYLDGIDHVVVSKNCLGRYIENSIRIFDIFSAYPTNEVNKISDHCPVIVKFETNSADRD